MEVKIVEFSTFSKNSAQRTLEDLLNHGWRIVSAAGAGTIPIYMVILQHEDRPSADTRADHSI